MLRGKVRWMGWKLIGRRLRAPSLLNETSLEQSAAGHQIKAADRVPQRVGRLPPLYFKHVNEVRGSELNIM